MRGFVLAPDAMKTTVDIAKPQLLVVGEAIASGIPDNVPVNSGTMRRSFKPSAEPAGDTVHVFPGSPFWHWMEYGTRNNSPARPIENTCRGLGLRYEAT